MPNQTPFILFSFMNLLLQGLIESSFDNIQVENRSKYRNDLIKMKELRHALLKEQIHQHTHKHIKCNNTDLHYFSEIHAVKLRYTIKVSLLLTSNFTTIKKIYNIDVSEIHDNNINIHVNKIITGN